MRIEHDLRFGQVRFGGITRKVCLECQPEAVPGDFVLVHVGIAIARIDREEAARAWQVLRELGQLGELEDGMTSDSEIAPGVPAPPLGPQSHGALDGAKPNPTPNQRGGQP